MAYQIGSACVSCGACADVCPVGAISQGDDRYVIDATAVPAVIPAPTALSILLTNYISLKKIPGCYAAGDFFTPPGECRAWRWSPAQRIQGTR